MRKAILARGVSSVAFVHAAGPAVASCAPLNSHVTALDTATIQGRVAGAELSRGDAASLGLVYVCQAPPQLLFHPFPQGTFFAEDVASLAAVPIADLSPASAIGHPASATPQSASASHGQAGPAQSAANQPSILHAYAPLPPRAGAPAAIAAAGCTSSVDYIDDSGNTRSAPIPLIPITIRAAAVASDWPAVLKAARAAIVAPEGLIAAAASGHSASAAGAGAPTALASAGASTVLEMPYAKGCWALAALVALAAGDVRAAETSFGRIGRLDFVHFLRHVREAPSSRFPAELALARGRVGEAEAMLLAAAEGVRAIQLHIQTCAWSRALQVARHLASSGCEPREDPSVLASSQAGPIAEICDELPSGLSFYEAAVFAARKEYLDIGLAASETLPEFLHSPSIPNEEKLMRAFYAVV
jgi:hypothetical protein